MHTLTKLVPNSPNVGTCILLHHTLINMCACACVHACERTTHTHSLSLSLSLSHSLTHARASICLQLRLMRDSRTKIRSVTYQVIQRSYVKWSCDSATCLVVVESNGCRETEICGAGERVGGEGGTRDTSLVSLGHALCTVPQKFKTTQLLFGHGSILCCLLLLTFG